MSTSLRFFVSGAVLAMLGAVPSLQAQNLKIAIIDSDRVIAESTRGQAAIASLKKLEEQKRGELLGLQQEVNDLRKRIEDGAQALAADRLKEMQKQMEDKMIAARRKQDDAQREFEAAQAEAFRDIEAEIIRVIDQVGKEGGYTLIFNKFRSGLVYATDSVDITNDVLARFNQSAKP